MNLIRQEPALAVSLLKAAIVCAVAFGLPLSTDQTAALIGVATAVLALGGVTRSLVTPVKRVEDLGASIGGNATKLVDAITGKGE